MGDKFHVAAPQCRAQECVGGRTAKPISHGATIRADPFTLSPVQIRKNRPVHILCSRQKPFGKRVHLAGQIGDRKRGFARFFRPMTFEPIVGFAHGVPAPTGGPGPIPIVKIMPKPTHICHRVDRA